MKYDSWFLTRDEAKDYCGRLKQKGYKAEIRYDSHGYASICSFFLCRTNLEIRYDSHGYAVWSDYEEVNSSGTIH